MALKETRHFHAEHRMEYHFTEGITVEDEGTCNCCGEKKVVVTAVFDNQDGVTEGTMYIGTTLCADCIVNSQAYGPDDAEDPNVCLICRTIHHKRDDCPPLEED